MSRSDLSIDEATADLLEHNVNLVLVLKLELHVRL